MGKKIKCFLLFIMVIIGSFANANEINVPDKKIADCDWVLEKLYHEGTKGSKSSSGSLKNISMKITEEGSVSGNTICNRYFGKCEIKASSIKISSIASTKMFCENSELEDIFISSLENVNSYSIHKNTLKLMKNGKTVMIFKRDRTKQEKK